MFSLTLSHPLSHFVKEPVLLTANFVTTYNFVVANPPPPLVRHTHVLHMDFGREVEKSETREESNMFVVAFSFINP